MAGEKRKNLKLDTPSNVRKSLSKVANMVLNKELDVKTANSLAVICNAILGSIRVDEQEKKLQELEQLIKEIQK